MMTADQKNYVTEFLVSKQFSLDILVEVRDHMFAQIEDLLDEQLDFETAFSIVKISWEKDLRLVYRINIPVRKISAFQRNIERKVNGNIIRRSILYFLMLFAFSIVLTLVDTKAGSRFLFMLDIILASISVFVTFRYFKMWWSAGNLDKRKISIYQRRSILLGLSGFYILIYNFNGFDDRFDAYYQGLAQLIGGQPIGYDSIWNFIMTYVFILTWIIGINYFLNYKKSVKDLTRQIGFKL